jgi:uncharacterized OB-fold protein
MLGAALAGRCPWMCPGEDSTMNAAMPFTHPDVEYFWKGVANDQLVLRRCLGCGVIQDPPQATPICGGCHGLDFEEVVASGRGTIYTWISSVHPGAPPGAPARIAAVIALDEGVRLVSNVVDADAAQMRNDAPVELCFREVGGIKLPQFRLVEQERA